MAQAQLPAGLLGFLMGGNVQPVRMQAPALQGASVWAKMGEQRRKEKQKAADMEAYQAQMGELFGSRATTQQDEIMAGERSNGLKYGQFAPIVQEAQDAQDATGMYQGATDEQKRWLDYNKAQMMAPGGYGIGSAQSALEKLQTSSMGNEQSGMNNAANNKNAITRQAMQNRQSGANTRANIAGQMARQQVSDEAAMERQIVKQNMAQELKLQEPVSQKDILDNTMKLKKDFRTETANFKTVNDAWENINNLGDTSIGQVGKMYSIMKIFDPGAAVQEGDKANIENAGGVPANIMNVYNALLSGKSISPEVIASIEAEAGNVYEGKRENYEIKKNTYTDMASDFGVNPEYVTGRKQYEPVMKKTAPAITEGMSPVEKRNAELEAMSDAELDAIIKEMELIPKRKRGNFRGRQR